MKESRLIQMEKNIDTLGRVASKLAADYQRLEMIVMGDHEVIKRLGEFPEIIKQMQDEQDTKSSGATEGDQGTSDSSESSGLITD